MPGQPDKSVAMHFDVTKLEIEDPADPDEQIIHHGQPFTLTVTFDGYGRPWGYFERKNEPYTAKFFAESMGPGPEIELGTVKGNLKPGGGPYTVTLPVSAGIPDLGLYRLACTVFLDLPSWVAGYAEGVMLYIHP